MTFSTRDALFLQGGGTCGELVRTKDWSETPLGPISAWPVTLKSAVGMLLRSRHPMFLWWGPDLIQFYNDAYSPSFGHGKHPAAMGQRGRDCWDEIWPVIWPQIDDVMRRSTSSWNEDALVPIFRNGKIEEVYWTYGYSPVSDDDGEIAGTLVVCTETTSRVLAERRLQTLRTLQAKTVECSDFDALMAATYDVLAKASFDIPFALTYELDPAATRVNASTNLDHDRLQAVDLLVLEDCTVDRSAASSRTRLLPLPLPGLPGRAFSDSSAQAFVVPLTMNPAHVMVFGLSPRLPFDAGYESFLATVVEHVDVAVTKLHARALRNKVDDVRRKLLLQVPLPTALLTGPEHFFELANPLYCQMVGGRQVMGKTYCEAFPELVGTALPGILDGVYQRGEPYVTPESEVFLDRAGDGSLEKCFFRFNLEPLRDNDHHVYGMLCVALDITAQVNARHELEASVVERDALLRQLELASIVKDEFLATVSHELRTPLTAILGWARLMDDDDCDAARIKKGVAVILRNARAQALLVDDILDVSRIITGKVRMSLKRVDLAAVMHAAVETVRPSAEAKQVGLQVLLEPALGAIVADDTRLQQVVWNLLSNAVKFTPKGGHVTLDVVRGNTDIVITVTDTGRGISAAFLPHIFERFRQDDSSTTKQQAGLGLGLAIVRHLVELHGGSVTVQSAGEGQGSTFVVLIPIRTVEARPEGVPRDRQSGELPSSTPDSRHRLHAIHVLVVDDQDDARDLFATLLEDAGARVFQADSAAKALKILAASKVAVIISDVGMPDEDGYTFLRRVRTGDGPNATVPAVALTGFARKEDSDKAIAAGFQEHLAKPVDPTHLIEVVATLIGR